MWIRKSDEEILKSNEKYKFNIFSFLAFFLFFFTLTFFFRKLSGNGYRGRLTPSGPLSWSESISQIPSTICFSLLICLLIYYFLKNKHKIKKQTVICDKCNAVIRDNGNGKCKCGGELINIDLMKWIDD